ncbi:hypothetical protein DCE79_17410 [Lysinibacillus sp. 2017]|uniref:hypothetical protein n=1 Tax=unclassified Lysinibacillus TaxID=2636778 RepID=UPI000D527760|nr:MULTISPECIES: hypothetical protein [unclassified Lysinibacillus]AWE09008.1 hypothetical protein DCE79_17410 [Lysinibacillus sp. 2017]TGN35483.1 hypothetical protein E4L99_09205 [Lysinibacillus sp. S2017]
MTNYRLTPLRDTSANKGRIIEKTRNNMQTPEQKPKRHWMPAMITACTLIIAVFLAGPSIYQALFNKQNFTIEKVVIPNVPYPVLANAIYIDKTNEFIYSADTGIYSFDVANKQQTLLIKQPNQIFDYAVSEKWLIWPQEEKNELKIHSLNRQTNEIQVYETDYFYGIELKNDTLIFMGLTRINGNSSVATYKVLNLNTGHTEVLREIGDGSNSRPTIDGSLITISERVKMESGVSTNITVQDFEQLNDIGNYIVPYRYVENISLVNNKVYGYMWNDREDEPAILGVVDLESGQFERLKTSVSLHDYATDGEHFAIAVQKGKSNTVQLFETRDGKLERISTLPSIKERLVLPRFTKEGTLVVNGEGPDKAMYLIRFE